MISCFRASAGQRQLVARRVEVGENDQHHAARKERFEGVEGGPEVGGRPVGPGGQQLTQHAQGMSAPLLRRHHAAESIAEEGGPDPVIRVRRA